MIQQWYVPLMYPEFDYKLINQLLLLALGGWFEKKKGQTK